MVNSIFGPIYFWERWAVLSSTLYQLFWPSNSIIQWEILLPPSLLKSSCVCVCECVVHLFLVVPDCASSVLLESGVVAASASVCTNVVPHLHMYRDLSYPHAKLTIVPYFNQPAYLLLLHSNQRDGQPHSASSNEVKMSSIVDYMFQVFTQNNNGKKGANISL